MVTATGIRARQLGALTRDLADFLVRQALAFAGAVVQASAELEGGGFVHFACDGVYIISAKHDMYVQVDLCRFIGEGK